MKHNLWKKKFIMGSDQFPSCLYISLIKTLTPKFRDETEFNYNNSTISKKELKTLDPKSKQKNRLRHDVHSLK